MVVMVAVSQNQQYHTLEVGLGTGLVTILELMEGAGNIQGLAFWGEGFVPLGALLAFLLVASASIHADFEACPHADDRSEPSSAVLTGTFSGSQGMPPVSLQAEL